MTDEQREQPVKKEPLVNKDILRATFIHPTFLSHLTQLMHHAHLNLAEGIFIVQNINGQPVISDLKKSKRIGSVGDEEESLSTTTRVWEVEEVMEDLRTGEITTAETDVIKPNIILEVHSHPIESSERSFPEQALRPSVPDLDLWEKLKILVRNPYLIKGIIVRKGNVGLLLLFQEDPTKPQANYYQKWNDDQGSMELLRLMRESGIRYEILRFDIKQKSFPNEELEKLKKFEVEVK